MEVFTRLSTTKFIKTGICTYFYESVEKLFREYLDPFFAKFDSHIWRREKLWCEDTDLVFKNSLKAVQDLYKKYSGKYSLPGAPRFTSMDEFITMV